MLEFLSTSVLAILVTNAMDFFRDRSHTVWAPIKLTRHDLLNAIYLEKVLTLTLSLTLSLTLTLTLTR